MKLLVSHSKAKSPPAPSSYGRRLRGRQIPASPNDASCSRLPKSTPPSPLSPPGSPPTRYSSSTLKPRSKSISRPAEMDKVDLPNPIPSSRSSHPPALHIQIPERSSAPHVQPSTPEIATDQSREAGEQNSKPEALGQEPQHDHDYKHELAAPLPIANIQPLPLPLAAPTQEQIPSSISLPIPPSTQTQTPAPASSEHGYYNYSPAPPSPQLQAHIPMWEEPLPPYDREWGLWKTACRVRVWEM